MKKLVTHNSRYHPDDIFACAVIQLYLDKKGIDYQVIRTRDEEVIKTGDYVFDVGGVYDPATNRFDHHQKEGAGMRSNTIPYASFGLTWKHFGMELCQSQEDFDEIDLKIVSGIDAVDNGISISSDIFEDVKQVDFGDLVYSFAPSWKNTSLELWDEGFEKSVNLAKGFLTRHLQNIADRREGKEFVESTYQAAEDKRLIIFDKYCNGKEQLAEHPEPLFAVFPDILNDRWLITTVRDKGAEFVNRKDLPAAWAGLRDKEFAEVSGVEDAVFCHKGLFLAGTKSREGVLELAKKALLM